MASGNIKHYLGRGDSGDRPVSPDLATTTIGLYWNEDTATLDLWDGAVWQADILGGAVATLPAVGTVSVVAGTASVDCLSGTRKHFTLSLTGNTTLALISPAPTGYPTEFEVRITNTGSFSLTLPSGWKPLGGSDTAVAQGSGAVTRLSVVTYDGGTTAEYAMQERGA